MGDNDPNNPLDEYVGEGSDESGEVSKEDTAENKEKMSPEEKEKRRDARGVLRAFIKDSSAIKPEAVKDAMLVLYPSLAAPGRRPSTDTQDKMADELLVWLTDVKYLSDIDIIVRSSRVLVSQKLREVIIYIQQQRKQWIDVEVMPDSERRYKLLDYKGDEPPENYKGPKPRAKKDEDGSDSDADGDNNEDES